MNRTETKSKAKKQKYKTVDDVDTIIPKILARSTSISEAPEHSTSNKNPAKTKNHSSNVETVDEDSSSSNNVLFSDFERLQQGAPSIKSVMVEILNEDFEDFRAVKEETSCGSVTEDQHGDSEMEEEAEIGMLKVEFDEDGYQIDAVTNKNMLDIAPTSCQIPSPIELRVHGVMETEYKTEPADEECPPTIGDDPLETESSLTVIIKPEPLVNPVKTEPWTEDQKKRKNLDSNEDQENVLQCRASQNLENVQLEQNKFLTQQLRIYEESHECITPKVILHRNTDIPGDLSSKESNEASPRNIEDLTTSNLKDHKRVQNIFKEFIKIDATDKTAAESINEVTFTLADDNKERPTSVPRSKRVQYTCDKCQQCCSSKCELERHVRVCSDVWKKNLSRENSTSTYTAHNPHQCNICKKQFSAKRYLSNHMRTHIGKEPNQCNVCKKLFSSKRNLRQHILIHTGEKPFHCDICKNQFTTKQSLMCHTRTHTGVRLFHCDICKKQFAKKQILKCHIRTHTGDKSYQCHTCNKQFSQKSNLIRHIRTHTGEKPFLCDICNNRFTSDYMSIHMRTHTGEKPYPCDLCDKRFLSNTRLREHIRTHTGEKPCYCDICTKQFSRKSSLIRHIRAHTGEKPYQCHTCNKQFSQRSHLNRHMYVFKHV